MSHGINAYAAYLPRHRLQHAAIGAALGIRGGDGARVVASFDEDATTMGVAVARQVTDTGIHPGPIYLATTSRLPRQDERVGDDAALDLDHDGFAVDLAGSARSAIGALRAAAATGGVAVLSDMRTGLPASADERRGADGAAAFRFGGGDSGAVQIVAETSQTAEFLDRWRAPGQIASYQWEERFGLEIYRPLVRQAMRVVLERAGIAQTDRVVNSSTPRTAATIARELATANLAGAVIGYAEAADIGLRLAAALDDARPGETILLVSAADGADAAILQVGDGIAQARRGRPVMEQLELGRDVGYVQYLMWRATRARAASAPSTRTTCGPSGSARRGVEVRDRRHRLHRVWTRACAATEGVCRLRGGRPDGRRPLAAREGTVATFTVDRLAFSPSPPMIDAVVDFDGGGRYTLEVADATPEEIDIGTRVGLRSVASTASAECTTTSGK